MSQYYIMRLLYFWSSKYSIDEQNFFFEKHLSFKNKKLCLEKQWTIKSLLIYLFFCNGMWSSEITWSACCHLFLIVLIPEY